MLSEEHVFLLAVTMMVTASISSNYLAINEQQLLYQEDEMVSKIL